MNTENTNIEAPYQVNGNTYSKVGENSDHILMEGKSPGGKEFWEVWIKRYTKKEFVFPNGTVIPEGSLIKPSNESFGTYAWCFYSRDRAILKFNGLI